MNTWILRQRGQTLVEVIIATAVIIMLVTGLLAGTTASLKANLSARMRSMATKYGQDAIESMRSYRDRGWLSFEAIAAGTLTYCMDLQPIPTSLTTTSDPMNDCADNLIVTVGSTTYRFMRYVTFSDITSPDGYRMTVTVKWRDGAAVFNRQSIATTDFTRWK